MRGAANFHRLRKYARKKNAARGNAGKWDRLAQLYWRYHMKVYGPIGRLWDMDFIASAGE